MRSTSLLFYGFIALLFVTLPSFSVLVEVPYNSKRVFEIGFLVILASILIFKKEAYKEVKAQLMGLPRWVNNSLIIILCVGVISSALSKFPFYAFLELSIHFLLVMSLFGVITIIKNDEEQFIKVFALILTAMILLYFTRFNISYIYNFIYPTWPVWPSTRLFQLIINGEPYYPEPFLGFSNARFLNHVQTWTLPILALFIVQLPKKLWAYRSILYFSTSFWWMLVFASDARGTMVASIFSIILVSILFRSKIKKWLIAYLTTTGIGFVSYILFFKVFIPKGGRTVFSRFDDNQRIKLASYAVDLFKENPFFGAGPMHYADIQNGYIFAHPHNFYLQILSEWGIIVFILSSVLFAFLLIKWIGFCRSEKGMGEYVLKHAALSASLFAGLLHGFVSGVFHTPLSQLLAVIVIGWMIVVYQKNHQDKNADSLTKNNPIVGNNRFDILSRGLVIIAVMYLVMGSFTSYRHLPENREKYMDEENTRMVFPRFWDYGYIGTK